MLAKAKICTQGPDSHCCLQHWHSIVFVPWSVCAQQLFIFLKNTRNIKPHGFELYSYGSFLRTKSCFFTVAGGKTRGSKVLSNAKDV